MDVKTDLIYDIGMHRGLDSKFYLEKGFRVVALEANPELAEKVRSWLWSYVKSGQLQIVENALTDSDGDTISFYVNPEKDDWSSTNKSWAEKERHQAREIVVPTITLDRMFSEYGLPYYVKCDIEGEDDAFVRQLTACPERPPYVSVEAFDTSLVDMLTYAGYSSFQIVNQGFNWKTKAPNPAREGTYVDAQFNGHMSGLFGKELPEDRWFPGDRIKRTHLAFRELRKLDPTLTTGWLDFHARME